MDIDSIPLGSDFRKILKCWVNECDVLLALISPGWVSAADPRTRQNPRDFVRIEIAEALARNIPVVPVLLDGATMPDTDLLPDELKDLIYRPAVFVEFTRFDDDIARLIRKLGLARGAGQTGPAQTPSPAARAPAVDEVILVDAPVVQNPNGKRFKPGGGKTEWFKDYEHGPEMVVVPAGSFMMGSPDTEPQRESWQKGTESPLHKVTISQPFAVGRHPITRAQFAAFVNNTGYNTDGGAQC